MQLARLVVIAGVTTAVGLASLWIFLHAVLNFAVPLVVNQRPERFRVGYTVAWMIVPGQIEVRGLRVRGQGRNDQWMLGADRVSGTIDMPALRQRVFHVTAADAKGLTVRYRRRADALGEDGVPGDTSNQPLIPGLANPPVPTPEALYPDRKPRWVVAIDEVRVDGVREAWLGDFRVEGDAVGSATVRSVGSTVDVEGDMWAWNLNAGVGRTVVATGLRGTAHVLVDALDRDLEGADRYSAVSADAELHGQVQDLRFLDFYLSAVPSLWLDGSGDLRADVGLRDGGFAPGSEMSVAFPELRVRFLEEDIVGEGRLTAHVTEPVSEEEVPESRVAVTFYDFAVTPVGYQTALVDGNDFRLTATSPDTALATPFATVDVDLVLPDSRIPDIRAYEAFLPVDVGLGLRAGTGRARGRLRVSSADSAASGDLHITGNDVVARYDGFDLTGDFALHANLARADLVAGRYDLSGSTFELTDVGVVDTSGIEADRDRNWTAGVDVVRGVAHAGAPIFLDTTLAVRAEDSNPFVAIFVEPGQMPEWARRLVEVEDVRGDLRVRLGTSRIELDPFAVTGGAWKIDMRMLREGTVSTGDLFVRYGPLSMGVEVRGAERELKLLGAKGWFEDGTEPVIEVDPETLQKEEKKAERQERREERKERKAGE